MNYHKKMKILLIVPKYTYKNFKTKPNYHYIFPIGLAYISAILKKEKFDYDCLNLNHEEGTIEEIIKRKTIKIPKGKVRVFKFDPSA